MIVAPIPENEAKRLQALKEYELLDSPCEIIFDNITKLAASICQTPICAISLIDEDRQWLKSSVGMDTNETSRDVAFCAHTILGDEILEVPDTEKDKRFAGNPLVTGDPKIKFYSGCPITTPSGYNIGSICVIDTVVRKLTSEQRESLRYIANIIIALFESRKKSIQENRAKADNLIESQKLHAIVTEKLDEVQQINLIIGRFSEMYNALQSCLTEEEYSQVIKKYALIVFPFLSGALYLYHVDGEVYEPAVHWGESSSFQSTILSEDCWALRRGQSYISAVDDGLRCHHFNKKTTATQTMCFPLTAQGEEVGLLCLEHDGAKHPINPSFLKIQGAIAKKMAETIAQSIRNMQLRRMLYDQSVHDPLTNLHNRRYLKDYMKREIPRAIRHNKNLGVLMIDIDHFKKFNDQFGHDAGDEVLVKSAKILQRAVKEYEVACRMGGEEFAIIIQADSREEIMRRVESVYNDLHISFSTRDGGQHNITVSIGLAIYPDQKIETDDLLMAADKALYLAKESGRDKIMVYNDMKDPSLR